MNPTTELRSDRRGTGPTLSPPRASGQTAGIKSDAEYRAAAEAACAGKFLPNQMADAIRAHIMMEKQFDRQAADRANRAAAGTNLAARLDAIAAERSAA